MLFLWIKNWKFNFCLSAHWNWIFRKTKFKKKKIFFFQPTHQKRLLQATKSLHQHLKETPLETKESHWKTLKKTRNRFQCTKNTSRRSNRSGPEAMRIRIRIRDFHRFQGLDPGPLGPWTTIISVTLIHRLLNPMRLLKTSIQDMFIPMMYSLIQRLEGRLHQEELIWMRRSVGSSRLMWV